MTNAERSKAYQARMSQDPAWVEKEAERHRVKARRAYARNKLKPEWVAKTRAQQRAYYSALPHAERQRRARKAARTFAGIVNAPDENREGACPICEKHKKLVCDHHHATGEVRGWLCRTCNSFLGPKPEGRPQRAALYEQGLLCHDSKP